MKASVIIGKAIIIGIFIENQILILVRNSRILERLSTCR